IARGRLLVDRDRRREPFDIVDVRLLHLPQELAGIRGERLDVAALTFGVDRVERERRLARARQSGHHDEPVPREAEVDVLEVMLARALDDDRIEGARGRRSHAVVQPVAASFRCGYGVDCVGGAPRRLRYSPTTTSVAYATTTSLITCSTI